MTRFSVGDSVIILYGNQQGRKATVLRAQAGDAYTVKVEDGAILFFSGKGMKPAEVPAQPAVR